MDLDDFRFTEVEYELMMLSQYVQLLEANLPIIVEAEKTRIWQDLDANDEGDRSVGNHLEERLDEGVTTRFLTAAALVATWATYEATIQTMAAYVQHAKEVSLKMSRLRGTFLERARTYFDDVLKFDLHPVSADWSRIERLAELRHVLAHANGRLPELPPDDRPRVASWLRETQGLTIVEDEYLVVSLTFARESLAFVESLLTDLVERVRASFK
jgi:hypothetical protein